MTDSPASIRTMTPDRRSARLAAVAVAGLLAVGPLLVASPAFAAEIPGAVSGVTVEGASGSSPIGRYETLKVRAEWAVPDNSSAGDTFTLTLPAQLEGLTSTFPLQDADGGTFGSCTVAAAAVLCTLSDLVETRPLDVGGNLFFSGRFTDAIVPGQTNVLEFPTGTTVEEVPVDVAAVVPYAGNGFRKSGRLQADGTVTWYIDLPQSATGLEQDLTDVVITDDLDPSLAFVGPERVRLTRAASLNQSGSGPLYTEEVDRSTYSVAITGQRAVVSIPVLPAGFYYRLVVDAAPVGTGTGPYTNSATLSATELASLETAVATVEFAAGGDAGGVAPGSGVGGVVVGGGAVGGVVSGAAVSGSAPELAATGAPTAGTLGLGALALLSVVAGLSLTAARRSALRR